ncbi:(2Fe-2S) ferredoxin domain-containing protein [bacterium]|nr:(2Fe-2S) ferredoxin domain-containing protein [bacterium]
MTTLNGNPTQIIRKVFICTNGKCASYSTAYGIYEELMAMIRERGLDEYDAPLRVKCLVSGCLDVCENGPVMVVHPGATYYQRVDHQALQRIFDQHLLQGEIVREYVHIHKSQLAE